MGGAQEREEQLSGGGEDGELEWDDEELCNLPSTKIPLWPPSGSFSNSRSPLPGLTLTISTTLTRERGKGNYEDDIAERQPKQRPGGNCDQM